MKTADGTVTWIQAGINKHYVRLIISQSDNVALWGKPKNKIIKELKISIKILFKFALKGRN